MPYKQLDAFNIRQQWPASWGTSGTAVLSLDGQITADDGVVYPATSNIGKSLSGLGLHWESPITVTDGEATVAAFADLLPTTDSAVPVNTARYYLDIYNSRGVRVLRLTPTPFHLSSNLDGVFTWEEWVISNGFQQQQWTDGTLVGDYPTVQAMIQAAARAPASDINLGPTYLDTAPDGPPIAVGINSPRLDAAFNVKSFHAVGDGITDDTAACVAALTAALAVRGRLKFPGGDYLISGSGAQIFLLTSACVEIFGDGMDSSRIIVSSSVANTVDVFRVSPPATGGQPTGAWAMTENGRDNRGLYIHDLAIIAQSEPSLFANPYPSQPARHAIHFDVSTSGQFLHNFTIARVRFGSLSGRAMYFNNLNGTAKQNLDGIYQFKIENCIIRNGIKGDYWGDSIWITNNSFVGQGAAIESTQVVEGATTLNIIGNNITNRGGLIFHSGLKINIKDNIIELFVVPSAGSNGAILDFQGDVAEINRTTIADNIINAFQVGNELDGIRLDNTNTTHIHGNAFATPTSGTHYAVKTTPNAINTIFGAFAQLNAVVSGTGTLTNSSSNDPFPGYTAYTINVEPAIASPTTFIPNYLGVDRAYAKSLRVMGGTTPSTPSSGTGGEFWYDSDGRINNSAYDGSGGSGVTSFLSFDRDASAFRDMQIAGKKGLLNFSEGITFDTGTVSATAGAATLNKQSGTITSEALTTAAGSDYVLTLTNSLITTTSKVFVTVDNGTNTTEGISVQRVTPGPGSAVIRVRNVHAASALNGTIKISFVVF